MTHALLLACGNALRGDDGVGLRIGEILQEYPPTDGIEIVLTQQLLPEHAELVSRAELVVFVDCCATTAPGAVTSVSIEPAGELPRILTHHLDPASLLRMAVELYGSAPSRAVLVTVGGSAFEMEEKLSGRVAAAMPRAVAAVIAALRGYETRVEANFASSFGDC